MWKELRGDDDAYREWEKQKPLSERLKVDVDRKVFDKQTDRKKGKYMY